MSIYQKLSRRDFLRNVLKIEAIGLCGMGYGIVFNLLDRLYKKGVIEKRLLTMELGNEYYEEKTELEKEQVMIVGGAILSYIQFMAGALAIVVKQRQ